MRSRGSSEGWVARLADLGRHANRGGVWRSGNEAALLSEGIYRFVGDYLRESVKAQNVNLLACELTAHRI